MRQDGGGPGSGQGGRGLSEKRMFKQDQKDGRRQAGRVLIFLLTPAFPESPLPLRPAPKQEIPLPSSMPQVRTLAQPPHLTRAAFNQRQVQEVNSNPSRGHSSHPGAFRPVTDISCLLVTHLGSWVPGICLPGGAQFTFSTQHPVLFLYT